MQLPPLPTKTDVSLDDIRQRITSNRRGTRVRHQVPGLVKFLLFIGIVGGGLYLGSPFIPPVVTLKNLTPIHQFGDQIELRVTVFNLTFQPKTLYFDNADTNRTTIFFDSIDKLAPNKSSPDKSVSQLTIPPFGSESTVRSFTVREGMGLQAMPQALEPGVTEIFLTRGSHTIVGEWGGYVSGRESLMMQ